MGPSLAQLRQGCFAHRMPNDDRNDDHSQKTHAVVLGINRGNLVATGAGFPGFLRECLYTAFHGSVAPERQIAAAQVKCITCRGLKSGRPPAGRRKPAGIPAPVHCNTTDKQKDENCTKAPESNQHSTYDRNCLRKPNKKCQPEGWHFRKRKGLADYSPLPITKVMLVVALPPMFSMIPFLAPST